MKAAAYEYAESGGPPPREVVLLSFIDRFGAQAVFGRTLGAGEMQRMMATENIVNAWRSRDRYRDKDGVPNWSEWSAKHREQSRILNEAAKVAGDDE